MLKGTELGQRSWELNPNPAGSRAGACSAAPRDRCCGSECVWSAWTRVVLEGRGEGGCTVSKAKPAPDGDITQQRYDSNHSKYHRLSLQCGTRWFKYFPRVLCSSSTGQIFTKRLLRSRVSGAGITRANKTEFPALMKLVFWTKEIDTEPNK